MKGFAIILTSVGALLVAGSFLDKYYHVSRLTERARRLLIAVYMFIETKVTFRQLWEKTKEHAGSIVGLAMFSVLATAYVAIEIAPFQGEWYGYVFMAPEILITAAGIVALVCALLAILLSIARLTILVIQRASMHFLEKASDPKLSPFGYTFAILSVFVSLAGCAIELTGYFSTSGSTGVR